jgi:ribosome recycling factor
MPAREIVSRCKGQMRKAQEYLSEELKGVRTGRASPGLVEHVKVDVSAYGSSMDLRELATISTPEPALLIVKPYDPATSKDIEKAILASNLGLTPNVDGATIRLPIPMLSGERRQQLIQEIKRMAEAQKIAVRNARRDANKHVDALEKEHQLSKDQAADAKDEIQELTRQSEAKIDEQCEAKKKEVSAV